MSVMQGAPAYMNMPTIRGVGGLEVTTTIQPQTPRLGIRTGKRFRFFGRRALPFYGQPRGEGLGPTPFSAGYRGGLPQTRAPSRKEPAHGALPRNGRPTALLLDFPPDRPTCLPRRPPPPTIPPQPPTTPKNPPQPPRTPQNPPQPPQTSPAPVLGFSLARVGISGTKRK
jgi:hypothetical protein